MALIIMKVEDLPSGRRARVHFGDTRLFSGVFSTAILREGAE